jgi:hypothetical protein
MSVNIFEQLGTTGLTANRDKHAALVYAMAEVPFGLVADSVNFLTSINDLKKINVLPSSLANEIKRLYYHVDAFFKANPNGVIHLVPTTALTLDLIDLIDDSIQLVGYFTNAQIADATALTTLVNALNTKRNALRDERNRCIQIILSCGIDNIAAYTGLPDFGTAGTANYVALDCGQDYSDLSLAKEIFEEDKICGSIGLMLGIATKNTVKDHIGYRAINSLTQYGVTKAIIPTGDAVDVSDLTKTVKISLKDKGLIFIEKIETLGTFAYQNARNCTAVSSDRSQFNITRPENKAKRIIDLAISSRINKDFFSGNGGKLTKIEIDSLKTAIVESLRINMLQGGVEQFELDYEDGQVPFSDIVIDENQNIKITETINIVSKLKFKGTVSVINIYSTINLN